MRLLLKKLNILPRWIIFSLDLVLIALGYTLSVVLRFNFVLEDVARYLTKWNLFLYILCYFVAILIFRPFVGIIRYTHKKDVITVLKSVILANTLVLAFNFYAEYNQGSYLYPYSILVISFFLIVVFLLGYRFMVKELFEFGLTSFSPKRRVVIYGAGMAGRTTAQILQDNKDSRYHLEAFIDDNPKLEKTRIHGKKILVPKDSLEDLFKPGQVDELIIAMQDITPIKKRSIIEECLKLSITVRQVPSVDRWVGGQLSEKQIKDVRIEDLLGRKPIDIASKNAVNYLAGKVVLVTGAAGSIGSEISRQLLKCGVLKLVMLDQGESQLYDLNNELQSKQKQMDNLEMIVCDITNKKSMESVFRRFRPDIIFHAAAYKHVPLMENMPFEAVFTNILGSKILSDFANEFGVEKFVFISTDKAVNPTNIMGATKRAAEMYIQSQNREAKTEYITTRFGNVLGSNGSVIPLFRNQIKNGGPITVTHPEITRFFMTIPEACSLVLEAGAIGNGGEIFVFDMGRSIKIIDLAKKMIKLAGLELGRDIDVKFTGLRPGEKLYEEVLAIDENTKETHHPKIKVADVIENDYERVNLMILSINKSFSERNEIEMVRKLKKLVPEFKSKVSRFEILDLNR